MMKKVSVCIIAYNHENFIAECIESIVSQKADFDFEVIIGEDKSTDNTLLICKEYQEKYPEMIIRAESHTDSRGPASYNKLLSERRAKSTAQYVISMGIDESRISGVGMGEEDPQIDCRAVCSKDEYAKNRRSEFIIISR